MAGTPEEGQGFKIKDHRMFNADGSVREGAEEPAARNEAVPDVSNVVVPPAPHRDPELEAPSPSRRAEPPREDPRAARHHGGAPSDAGEIDFSQFVMSMAQIAVAYLGEIPNPQTGRPQLNLAAAKQQIDLLGMLEKKTRGNLTMEENQLLQSILTELRLHFVEVQQAVARAAKEPPRPR